MKILLAFILMAITSSQPKQVYLTAKGGKYHTDKSCRYIKGKELRTITLADAERMQLTKCKACTYNELVSNNK